MPLLTVTSLLSCQFTASFLTSFRGLPLLTVTTTTKLTFTVKRYGMTNGSNIICKVSLISGSPLDGWTGSAGAVSVAPSVSARAAAPHLYNPLSVSVSCSHLHHRQDCSKERGTERRPQAPTALGPIAERTLEYCRGEHARSSVAGGLVKKHFSLSIVT